MLKHIPAILTPDLLKILMEMGYGDEIVIADGNFPAAALAQRLVRLDGAACCDAVLSGGCLRQGAGRTHGSSAGRSGSARHLGCLSGHYRSSRTGAMSF